MLSIACPKRTEDLEAPHLEMSKEHCSFIEIKASICNGNPLSLGCANMSSLQMAMK